MPFGRLAEQRLAPWLKWKVDYNQGPPVVYLRRLPRLLRPALLAALLALPAAALAPFPAAAQQAASTLDTHDYGSKDDLGVDADPSAPPPPASTLILRALRKGDPAKALELADTHLAHNPRDAQVRFQRTVVLGELHRKDEAIAALEEMTRDFPELAEPYNNLAVIQAADGKLATAERYLQQAIAAQPDYVTARENLGDLYITLAAAAYGEALKLAPDNTAAKRKLKLTDALKRKLNPKP